MRTTPSPFFTILFIFLNERIPPIPLIVQSLFFTFCIGLTYSLLTSASFEKVKIPLLSIFLGSFTLSLLIRVIDELKDNCRIPTKDNPFMNPQISDYNTKNDHLSSCTSYNNKGIQRVIEKEFNEDLYRDINDIFGKNNSQRQFYTVPGNSIPNDQDTFAKWLYATPKTCKEGNGLQCAANMYGVNKGPLGD